MTTVKFTAQFPNTDFKTIATLGNPQDVLTSADFQRLTSKILGACEEVLDNVRVYAEERPAREPTNEDRANRIEEVLAAYDATLSDEHDPDDRSSTRLACVLADMRHWCALHKIDFDRANAYGQDHFQEEQADAALEQNAASASEKSIELLPENGVYLGIANKMVNAVNLLVATLDTMPGIGKSHISPMRAAISALNEDASDRYAATDNVATTTATFLAKAEKGGWLHASYVKDVSVRVRDWTAFSEDVKLHSLKTEYEEAADALRSARAGLQDEHNEFHAFLATAEALRAHPNFTGRLPITYFTGGETDPDRHRGQGSDLASSPSP